MRRAMSLLLCVVLSLPGCASAGFSRAFGVPRQKTAASADPALIAEYVQKLPAGSKIRVDTASGRSVRGTLIKANDAELVVQRNTRMAVPPESFAIQDVTRVFVETGSSNGKLMAIGAAVGAGAAIGVVWFIAFLALSGD